MTTSRTSRKHSRELFERAKAHLLASVPMWALVNVIVLMPFARKTSLIPPLKHL